MCQPTRPSGRPTSRWKTNQPEPVGQWSTNQPDKIAGWSLDLSLGCSLDRLALGSLFHVHVFLLFTSKVLHFWNFRPILSNIFFVNQPMSPMPFRTTHTDLTDGKISDQPTASMESVTFCRLVWRANWHYTPTNRPEPVSQWSTNQPTR